MRELILLRHAHAESAHPGQDDSDRPLSDTGRSEATAAGGWLRAHGLLPDRVLCSPAQRARQTLDGLGALDCTDIRSEASIYEATPGALVELADAHPDAKRLLLVGHNPGFETFVALLATGQSGDFRGMPPGGIAWFELDGTAEPGSGRLKAFWSP